MVSEKETNLNAKEIVWVGFSKFIVRIPNFCLDIHIVLSYCTGMVTGIFALGA